MWHAEQEPFDPSGLSRPTPVLGHVAGSSFPFARTFTSEPALPAAAHRRRRRAGHVPFHHFSQNVVQAPQNLGRVGVMALLELLELLLMAHRTILRRHDRRDHEAVVAHGILVALSGSMAFIAPDTVAAVSADFPLTHEQYTQMGFGARSPSHQMSPPRAITRWNSKRFSEGGRIPIAAKIAFLVVRGIPLPRCHRKRNDACV